MRKIKSYKNPSIVSGLTIEKILSMEEKELRSLAPADLRKVAGRLVSAGNKRIRRAEKREKTTTRGNAQKEQVFSVKGKSSEQIITEVGRAKQFLSRPKQVSKSTYKRNSPTGRAMSKTWDEINRMTLSELRGTVQTLAKTANRRIKAMEEKGYTSPATWRALEIGKFSTKGKNINELRNELARVRDFLESETSTISGWKKVRNDIMQTLRENYHIDISDVDFDTFWKSYEKLKELDPSVSMKSLKYSTLDAITDFLTDKTLTPAEIALKVQAQISDIYEEKAREGASAGDGGTSGYFE